MHTLYHPEPRAALIGWQQIQPAARLLYLTFPPGGTTPFTWREWTVDPEGLAEPMPFGDEVAELFAAAGYVLDLVEEAPVVTDMVVPIEALDAAGEHLRVRALTVGGSAGEEPIVPAPAILGPPDVGRLPDTASWFELHREAKRPWIAAVAGILSVAGATIVAEPGERP